mgnify:CR=1 FL=1
MQAQIYNELRDLKGFIIKFVGLKSELHSFDFRIDKAFFDLLQIDDIYDIEGDLVVTMDKKVNMLVFNFVFDGKFPTLCDRCGQAVEIPLKFDETLYVKISESVNKVDEDDIVYISPSEIEFDIHQFVYEYIILAIPMRCTHEDSINPTHCELASIESDDIENENENEEEIDPRWAALKNIKFDN